MSLLLFFYFFFLSNPSQPLDYETKNTYIFSVNVDEHTVSKSPDNQGPALLKRAQVSINVIDVDEPPVFSQTEYQFSIYEGPFKTPVIGAVSAKDPDKTRHKIRYKLKCIFIQVSKKTKGFLCSAVLS